MTVQTLQLGHWSSTRILLWIVCIVLACYHHLNTELESGPDSFVALVAVVAFPITMFIFDSLMLVRV